MGEEDNLQNGNGILWHNSATNETQLWYMNLPAESTVSVVRLHGKAL